MSKFVLSSLRTTRIAANPTSLISARSARIKRSCLGRRAFASHQDTPRYDAEFDTIVVGSGAAGLAAAITATLSGKQRVLLTEKSAWYGGVSAYSGGALWLPNNELSQAKGYGDSREASELYLRSYLKNSYDEDKMSAFLDSAPEMLSWLQSKGATDFVIGPTADYYMELPGALKVGRTAVSTPYDGRRLGSRVRHVRYPLQGYSALGSLQIDVNEIDIWQRPLSSWHNFSFVTKRLMRYALDQIRYGKGTVLCNGNALVGRLLECAVRSGVTLWRHAPATEPILEGSRVSGMVVRQHDRDLRVRAKKGVILAAGGFSRSPEFARKYLPSYNWTMSPRSNRGDGIRIGLASGGALPPSLGEDAALWAPISEISASRGPPRSYAHFFPPPGSIIVDQEGQRFANESAPYQDFGRAMNAADVRKMYMVTDARHLRRYGMGMALPGPYPLYNTKWRGYLTTAPTIPALAIKLGIDPSALRSTVNRYNQYAYEGKDLDFNRGANQYDRDHGDPAAKPNAALLPLKTGPFHAITMFPGNNTTLYGLETNRDGQVLDASGLAVPGLYAVGADANHLSSGKYPSGGFTLGPSMVFAYRAGLHVWR